jgi:3',5'-cyclic AMP phosphodiesterase CpdA
VGKPSGHGFSESNVREKKMYYATDIGSVRGLVLDSVNPYGGWQGSLDEEQFHWLEAEIKRSTKPVVLASHHPLSTMINGYAPSEHRICQEELQEMLLKYPHVILWVAGHVHRHHVEWVGDFDRNLGFWHIETASHIDWPQQSRTLEIVKDALGDIYIGLTVVDHAGELVYNDGGTPIELAALSRLLSANVWQRRSELGGPDGFATLRGKPEERNVVLKISKRFEF